MEYRDIVGMIGHNTKATEVVNTFWYGDTGVLSTERDIKFPAVILTINSITSVNASVDRINATLTYADMIGERRKKLDIHSTGIEVLRDIINRSIEWMYNIDDAEFLEAASVTTYNVYNNTQIHADVLTAVSASIEITYDNEVGECYFEDIDICEV